MSSARTRYDVVVVGGGHNGLVAAAYLARAGRSVLVLERLPHVGGAAVSAPAFAGLPPRLSRYSYLVGLMPDRLVRELNLGVELRSRRVASYTPWERDGRTGGLLVERPEGDATAASFRELTGTDDEYAAWRAFYARVATLTDVVAPTLMEPLPTERDLRAQVAPDVWRNLVDRPLGEVLETAFADDLVRGVVATDGLIGTFASLHDPSRVQNRCFLYHLLGSGDGGAVEWRVPVGGMGAVTDALLRAATAAGAEVVTGAGVHRVYAGQPESGVEWDDDEGRHQVSAAYVLGNVAPWVLDILLGRPADAEHKPAGAQLKVNLLLDRLPRLRSGIDPATAFAGTLHLSESYAELEAAQAVAAAGGLPAVLPGEVYCHTLTDDSILDGYAGHTLTYFGLHTPAGLFDRPGTKPQALAAALTSIERVLAEPLAGVLARDGEGRPCVEVKTPLDVEADLAMPGGHIFHGDLEWPWASARARLETPAERWGVATGLPGVLLCGSGARRGGAVSGLGGHNAAMAVLESS